MKIDKALLTQLRLEAENQRVQALAAANAAAGQVYLLDQQLAILAQPEPTSHGSRRATGPGPGAPGIGKPSKKS